MAKKITDERLRELKAFDETKTGVKGLVDAGVTKIPPMFRHDPHQLFVDDDWTARNDSTSEIPIIDLEGVVKDRKTTVGNIRRASEEYGFFEVINHGIPIEVLNEMIEGVRRFHEQDAEVKKLFYSRDPEKKFVSMSNYDLYHSSAACWRDTISCYMAPHPPEPQELPSVCRY